MNKTLLVMKHEIITTLSRPSFLFALFGVPIIGVAVFLVAGQFSKGSATQSILTRLVSSPPTVQAQGYVDQGGIIKVVPDSVDSQRLVAFTDEASAEDALRKGDVAGYFIIPADYIQSGRLVYKSTEYNPLGSGGQAQLLEWVLNANLLGGDAQAASLVNGPLDLQRTSLSTAPQRDENNMLTYWLPYAVTMIFYFIILGTASLMLSGIAKEKENRVMEILLVALSPRQLLTGKIAGLGLLGLVQTIAWVGTGRALLALGGTTFKLPAVFQLPASFLVWGLVFFLLGYAVYASLMAGLGSLVPNLREATQATILVIFPLVVPLFLINSLITDPHGGLSTFMSLFPLTAPVAMMARLSSGSVPTWQLLLAVVLLAGTALLVVRAVARMFHAQNILTGQPFSRKLFINTLLGKAN